jgi:hypothetical protein
VPANALAFVTIDTDRSSGQLRSAQAVLDEFPGKDVLLRSIRSAATKDGVDLDAVADSVGPVLDFAVLPTGTHAGVVGFAQPADEQRFEAQLGNGHSTVHTTIDGWTVFADSQELLDAVTSRQGNLSDEAEYRAALETIPGPGDAIVRAYASPAALKAAGGSLAGGLGDVGPLGLRGAGTTWVAAALTSDGGGFRLAAHAEESSSAQAAQVASPLVGRLPSGAIAALSIDGGGRPLPERTAALLAGLSRSLGVDLTTLVGALRGPAIAYVRPGAPVPELTIAATPADPAGTEQAISGLLARFVPGGKAPATVTVGGVTLHKVDLGLVALYWGSVDGTVVVTDSTKAIATLAGGSDTLAGDPAFKAAADGAGLPERNEGFLFLNMHDALPLIEGLAQLGGHELPATVADNLRPLRSILVFADRSGGLQNLVVSVATS